MKRACRSVNAIPNTVFVEGEFPFALLRTITPIAMMNAGQALQLVKHIDDAACRIAFQGPDFLILESVAGP